MKLNILPENKNKNNKKIKITYMAFLYIILYMQTASQYYSYLYIPAGSLKVVSSYSDGNASTTTSRLT